jgi:hypothetical protein
MNECDGQDWEGAEIRYPRSRAGSVERWLHHRWGKGGKSSSEKESILDLRPVVVAGSGWESGHGFRSGKPVRCESHERDRVGKQCEELDFRLFEKPRSQGKGQLPEPALVSSADHHLVIARRNRLKNLILFPGAGNDITGDRFWRLHVHFALLSLPNFISDIPKRNNDAQCKVKQAAQARDIVMEWAIPNRHPASRPCPNKCAS